MHFRLHSLIRLLLLSPLLSIPALAQDTPAAGKARIRIHIVEETGGQSRVQEKIYEVGRLSEAEQKAHIDKLLDSLGGENKRNRRITITFEEGYLKYNPEIRIGRRPEKPVPPVPPVQAWDLSGQLAFKLDSLALRFDTVFVNHDKVWEQQAKMWEQQGKLWEHQAQKLMADKQHRILSFQHEIGDKLKDKELRKHIAGFAPGGENEARTVRNVSIFPNQPYDAVLNLRFRVPEKGDVQVNVTDVRGKEVGRKEIKNFEGEFVGQIELKKEVKGTLFVSIVQNDDGVVRRVSLPETTGEK